MNKSLWGTVAISIFFWCLILGFSVGTVRGTENIEQREKELFYAEQEKALVAETRAKLNGLGFYNSGVMLTRVSGSQGEREYTFTIHHNRINEMNNESRAVLCEKLEKLSENFPCAVPEDHCSFRYEFFIGQ